MTAVKTPLDMAAYPITVVICSESDPSVTYTVQLPYCPCKDFRWRRSQAGVPLEESFCKHLREAMARVAGWHRATPATAEYGNLTYSGAMELLAGTFKLDVDRAAKLLSAVMAGITSSVPRPDGGGTVSAEYAPDNKAPTRPGPRRYVITATGPAATALAAPGPAVHKDVTRRRAIELLRGAGVKLGVLETGLDGLTTGAGVHLEAKGGFARVTVRDIGTGLRYTVTLP